MSKVEKWESGNFGLCTIVNGVIHGVNKKLRNYLLISIKNTIFALRNNT